MSTPEAEPRRTEIVEQAGSPTVRFTIDDHSFILPYAYFVKAEVHVQNKNRFLIIAYWSSIKVTILGKFLDQLAQWLAEYRLASVNLRTFVEKGTDETLPNIDQILVEMTEESSGRGKKRGKRPKLLVESQNQP